MLFWFFFYFVTFLSFFSFFEAVLLYSSGWPEIHYVVRLALNLWQSPCLSSSVEIIGLSWEYGFRVQHLPTACSKIWVSFTALFSSFSTNKQTNNISDPDWQLTSGILAHQLGICNGYESILWVWQTGWWKESPWLAHPKGTDRTSQLYSRNQRDIPEGCQKPT